MGVLKVVGVAVVAGALVAHAEDLAWTFDKSARTADVVTQTAAQNAAVVDAAANAAGVSGTLTLFDSRWHYDLLLEGWTYQHVGGLCIHIR